MAGFSETLMDHVMSPRNSGVMDDPDLTGAAGTLGAGPFMVVYLKLDSRRVAAAKFRTYGCGPAIAAGSVLTELVVGRTIQECRALVADDLVAALDGMPPDKLHCPALAIAALGDALDSYAG